MNTIVSEDCNTFATVDIDARLANPIKRQRGFVLTVELVLIATILGIGLFVGIVAVRDALFKYYVSQQSQEVRVYDGNNVLLGKAVGFDEHEAPLIPYIDRSQAGGNYRALIGIRDDRFTSREPVYFTQLNCQGPTVCMKRPSSERGDNRGYDGLPGTGAVGYLYGLQGAPNYAVGPADPGIVGSNPLPGWLYRQTEEACEYTDIQALTGSRYISQKVVFGEPCESPFVLPIDTVGTPVVQCSGSPGNPNAIPPTPGDATCPQVSVGNIPACGTTQQGNQLQCACPLNYYDVGALGVGNDILHTCCPDGSTGGIPVLGLPTVCLGSLLVKAESVPSANDPLQNALEPYEPPFRVNLPIDAEGFQSVAPDDCEGNLLPDGSCPTQTNYPVYTAPDGEGQGG